MIAGEVADQTTETADVVEQFLIDPTLRIAVGLAKGLFSTRRVAGAEPGEGQLTQQERLCASRS